MPFLNPKGFIKNEILPIIDYDQVEIRWSINNDFSIDHVLIYIMNRLIAKMLPRSTPGWSTIVSKDGPLAQKLEYRSSNRS